MRRCSRTFADLYGNPSSMHTFGGQVADQDPRGPRAGGRPAGLRPERDHLHQLRHGKRQHGDSRDAGRTCRRSARSSRPAWSIRRCWPSAATWRATAITVVELGVDKSAGSTSTNWSTSSTTTRPWSRSCAANNETGVIFPIEQIAEMVTSRGIVFHTDAVQVVGQDPAEPVEEPHQHAEPVGPQAARAQGHRRALRQEGHPRCAVHASAAIRKTAGAPARRTSPASSAWARRANWRRRTWTTRTPV